MKTKKPALKPLALLAGGLICCASNLPAQTAPTITTQPTNQTVSRGSSVLFSVTVAGAGPLSYQWQLNGPICQTTSSSRWRAAAMAAIPGTEARPARQP